MKFDYTQQPGKYIHDNGYRKDGAPLVSIITPFYNAGEYFEQTFNCVENQTFPWFEWIIVDDGSTKKEDVQRVAKIIKNDPRIRMLHKENGGIATARNMGIKNASTPYILPLDADDLIEPTFIEYCWWMLQKNKEASWSYSDSCGFGTIEYIWTEPFDPEKEEKSNLLTATALIRRDWIERVGYYGENSKHFNEDWYLWLKIMAKGGYPVQSKNEELFWYRRSDTGVLSIVQGDHKIAEKNKKIIRDMADRVIRPHKPIIFPNKSGNNNLTIHPPLEHKFSQRVYEKHDKTNILFLFPWFSMGGADKFNLDLLEGIDREKYNITVATTVASDNEWLQKFRSTVDQIFNLPNFMSADDYPEFISYLIQTREIDQIFVSNSYVGYCMLPWIRKNYPDISIVDYVHMEEWYWRDGGYARISGAMGALLDKTYVCNSETGDVLAHEFNRNPKTVETVHIGIDPDQFNRNYVPEGLIYKDFDIEKDRPIVLFICRLHPQKRPFLMLKIAEEVKKQIPDVAFVVVGDGPQYKALSDAVTNRGLEDTVYFAGAQNEVRPYYKDAKVTLICSTKEGLALTAYESCSMGVPVVSADVGGQKDLIDDEVGRLIPFRQDEKEDFDSRTFPKEELDDYVKAIVEILSDNEEWERLSTNCRKRIESNFTIQKMTDFFNEELASICKDPVLTEKRIKTSEALQLLGGIAEDMYNADLIIENGNKTPEFKPFRTGGHNSEDIDYIYHVLDEHTEVLNRHEEVVNRHEEVVNRHEEVVNRHEKSINHQWEVQKWHEQRLSAIEKNFAIRVFRKLFG